MCFGARETRAVLQTQEQAARPICPLKVLGAMGLPFPPQQREPRGEIQVLDRQPPGPVWWPAEWSITPSLALALFPRKP